MSEIQRSNENSGRFKKGNLVGRENLVRALPGKDHFMWKGGRIKRPNGYIVVHSPDHPHAGTGGYVREHRLVMEAAIGRYLDPKEVVHHKNHKRDDNRIENLALFSSNSVHMTGHTIRHH